MQFCSIWPIDRTLSGSTTPGLSESGSDGNEGVLCIPQSFSVTGTSLSDCFVSYPEHSLVVGFLPHCRGAVVVFYISSRQSKLPFGLSRFAFRFLTFPVPLSNFWGSFQVHHLQLESPSHHVSQLFKFLRNVRMIVSFFFALLYVHSLLRWKFTILHINPCGLFNAKSPFYISRTC